MDSVGRPGAGALGRSGEGRRWHPTGGGGEGARSGGVPIGGYIQAHGYAAPASLTVIQSNSLRQ